MTGDIHVYPTDDLRPHNTASRQCQCQPVIEGIVVIHNSFDGREWEEDDIVLPYMV